MVALEEVCRDYFPKLVGMCREWAGDEAEDLAQEALLRAMNNMHRFDDSRSVWPWLKVIARHLAVDKARRSGREVAFVEGLELRVSQQSGGVDVEERLLLEQAMEALPDRQRAAVALHYLEDRSGGEVAWILDMTPLALRQLLFRARRRLFSEYRRLAGSVPAVILMPAEWIRRRAVTARNRVASILGPKLSQADPSLSPVATQVVTGLVALALVWSTDGGVPGRGRPKQEPASSSAAATISDDGGQRVGSKGADRRGHGDGSRIAAGLDPASQNPGQRVKDSVEEITDPHRKVKQPEDARITSMAFSPRFEEDRTIFAAGYARCRTNVCPHILFRSVDGGAIWSRLPAAGYFGETLILPPGYGVVDRRIFAMGPAGLQVSEDDGQSFRTAAVAGPPNASGSAAISPGFNDDDPTILIGAQTLMRYRDDLRTIETVASTAMPGPLEPAYASGHAEEGLLVIGGLRLDPLTAKAVATVFSCSGALCVSHPLEEVSAIPQIRIDRYSPDPGPIYAFTQRGLYASRDGGGSFEALSIPHPTGLLWDIEAAAEPGRLFAAMVAEGRKQSAAGLWASEDGGGTWQRETDPSLSSGVTAVASEGRWIIAALADSGIACSADAGRSWYPRCRGSSA